MVHYDLFVFPNAMSKQANNSEKVIAKYDRRFQIRSHYFCQHFAYKITESVDTSANVYKAFNDRFNLFL